MIFANTQCHLPNFSRDPQRVGCPKTMSCHPCQPRTLRSRSVRIIFLGWTVFHRFLVWNSRGFEVLKFHVQSLRGRVNFHMQLKCQNNFDQPLSSRELTHHPTNWKGNIFLPTTVGGDMLFTRTASVQQLACPVNVQKFHHDDGPAQHTTLHFCFLWSPKTMYTAKQT